ncbi:LPXTG cell wall anchor domain-containing protein [Candidatus Woesearchaeota archaeon]|nr:LPXTG cell wall anchor domain-containing protein [Candidatus Woesearchaeota archaeon]
MKLLKQKIIAIIGASSALIGGAFAASGICPCTLAPSLAAIGGVSMMVGFLSKNSAVFIILGVGLLATSFIFYKKKNGK